MVDPYALSKEHVAIIGMAATNRHLAPYGDPDVEIWGINESYHPRNTKPKRLWKDPKKPEAYLERWDRWFQIHPVWDYMRDGNFNHENHPWWMLNEKGTCKVCHGKGKIRRPGKDVLCEECGATGVYDPARHRRTLDFPIYLQDEDPNTPNGFLYPLDDICKEYGLNAEHVRYHTNSMSLMLAFAMHIGIDKKPLMAKKLKKVSCWGFEMSSATEYGDQKPCAEFWLGILIGRAKHEGIELILPERCTLLGSQVPLYAFDKTPGLTSMHAEIRVNAIQQALNKAQAELNQIRGAKNLKLSELRNTKGLSKLGSEKLNKELRQIMQGEFDKVNELNSLFGALQEARHTQAEVSQSRTSGEIGYYTQSGKVEKVELAPFEKEATKALQEGAPEDRSDELSFFGPGKTPDTVDAVPPEEG